MVSSLPGPGRGSCVVRDEEQARPASCPGRPKASESTAASSWSITPAVAAVAVEPDHVVALCGQVAAQRVPSGAKARLPTRMSLKWRNCCVAGSKISMPLPEET